MSLITHLSERETSQSRLHPFITSNLDFAMTKFQLEKDFNFIDEDNCPPLACCLQEKTLCIANESGIVQLVDKHHLKSLSHWQAHQNAIFDVQWRKNSDNQLATASGDQCIVLWDVETHLPIKKFDCAHKGSIKSIHFNDTNMLASGARDGCIKIWDMRCAEAAVMIIEDAHLSRLPTPKTRNSPKSRPLRSNPTSSVTCVIYHPLTNQLFSGGANDATVKVWDMRKNRPLKKSQFCQSTPVRQIAHSAKKGNAPFQGFTSLAFNEEYDLFANCTDHSVYGYRASVDSHLIRMIGHKVNNFTRIKTLKDYVVSGSINGNAFIWNSKNAMKQAMQETSDMFERKCVSVWPVSVLPHFEDEVTAIECDNRWMNIYTCSDDQKISKWSLFSDLNSNQPKACPFDPHQFGCDLSQTTTSITRLSSHSPTINNTNSPSPFNLLSNWLNHSAKRSSSGTSTSSAGSAKKVKKNDSTPNNKNWKENNKSRSKRSLFNSNRKISDYFNTD